MSDQEYDPHELSRAIRRRIASGTIRWDVLQATISSLSHDPEFRQMFLGLVPESDRGDFKQVVIDAVRSHDVLLKRLAGVLDDVSLWPRIEAWAREHDPELCTAWEQFQRLRQKEREGDA